MFISKNILKNIFHKNIFRKIFFENRCLFVEHVEKTRFPFSTISWYISQPIFLNPLPPTYLSQPIFLNPLFPTYLSQPIFLNFCIYLNSIFLNPIFLNSTFLNLYISTCIFLNLFISTVNISTYISQLLCIYLNCKYLNLYISTALYFSQPFTKFSHHVKEQFCFLQFLYIFAFRFWLFVFVVLL